MTQLKTDIENSIVLIDIDGTLAPDSSDSVDPETLADLNKLKAKNTVYLCTNSLNTDRNVRLEKLLNLKIINKLHKKPSGKILDEIDSRGKKNIVVIGDKFLTDYLFAKNIGATFIKAKRKLSGHESFMTKLINFADDAVYKMIVYFQMLRPRHWVKNALIFAPLFFAGKIVDAYAMAKSLYLFFAFCSLASCIYIINDLADMNEDSLHPSKKNRPLASGKISKTEAIVLLSVLFLITVGLSFELSFKTALILMVYAATNLMYSFWLKHIVILDMFLIASLYILRIFAGGIALNLELSKWIILCTFFLSLFLISAKRRAEFNELGENTATREVIKFYNKDFLDHILTITTTASLVTYSLYVISTPHAHFLLYSVVFVAFGLMRYLYLIYRYNAGQSPEQTLFADKWIISTSLGWIVYNGLVFYFL